MRLRKPQYIVLSLAMLTLTGVLLLNYHLLQGQTNHGPQPQPEEVILANVKVMAVTAGEYAAKIDGFGEAKTHYTLSLTAQNSGQVTRVADTLESGCRVAKGTVLVQLDDTEYVAAVADAKSALATARLALLEEQREAAQARAEWQGSGLGGTPDSTLVLHEPQLVAAEAAVTKAETNLATAEKNLQHTRIIAPFDAIVVERLTAPGSYLQTGSQVATLYSTDLMEIAVPLSARDWANLPDPETLSSSPWPVRLTGVENGQTWQGRALRAQQHVDETSRQRILFIGVDAPLDQEQPLLPGTFVQAEITGQLVDKVWKVQSSALSQRGEIWYLNENDTLAKFAAEPLFSDSDAMYIQVPKEFEAATTRVVVHPLSSYLVGMKINPVAEGHDAE